VQAGNGCAFINKGRGVLGRVIKLDISLQQRGESSTSASALAFLSVWMQCGFTSSIKQQHLGEEEPAGVLAIETLSRRAR
jgi:hypothetical protein